MKSYLDILQKILDEGTLKPNRTGVDTISITGYMFEHDMQTGFPLLTTKKMGLKSVSAELEFFIKGLSDKRWLQERGCHIWDAWCNPSAVPYGTDEETKSKMARENELGRIYGVQWRDWRGCDFFDITHTDQLKNVVDKLKSNPLDRRMIVSAWQPAELGQMALPPCHYAWQVLSDGEYIDLLYNQRSCDTFLGVGYNIASYALLLLLLAKESNLIPRKLIAFMADVHIYVNHIAQVKLQLSRNPYTLPIVIIPDENWKGIFEWKYNDFVLQNYQCHDVIKAPVAV
jgi:thymidylate synthase